MDEVILEFAYKRPPEPKCPKCKGTIYVRDDFTILFECGYETFNDKVVHECQKRSYRDYNSDSWNDNEYFGYYN